MAGRKSLPPTCAHPMPCPKRRAEIRSTGLGHSLNVTPAYQSYTLVKSDKALSIRQSLYLSDYVAPRQAWRVDDSRV